MNVGQLGNTDAGLEEDFYNGTDADIQANGIPQVFNLGGSEDPGGLDFVFGVG